MSDELNEMVGDLLDQLNDANKKVDQVAKEKDPLKKEDLENFVIAKAGELVEQSLTMVGNVKDYVYSTPESKDVSSLSDLINATAAALETLNKIVVSNKRNETVIKAKEMDINSRKELQDAATTGKMLATREDIFKLILSDVKDADVVEIKKIEDQSL